MTLSVEEKKEIINDFKLHDKDTGSSEVQIAILTKRINELTEHLKIHKKDFTSRRGLLKLVGRRRKLLDYLKRKNNKSYQNLLKVLKLRK